MTEEDARTSKTAIANNEVDVTVTCQGFPYLHSDGMNNMLDILTFYLVSLLKDKLNIDCALAWMHTKQTFTWKLKTNHLEAAKYLCTTWMDLSVSFADSSLCNIHFKSGYHMLATEDMHTCFKPSK